MNTNWKIYERDIDVFLAEELVVSKQFFNWFMFESTKSNTNYSPLDASVSVTDSDGESDLIVRARNDVTDEVHGLFIEDKINAKLMPSQAKRYYTRADTAVTRGEFSSYSVVLCAPASYIDAQFSTSGFRHQISYEAISNHLAHKADKRSQYRSHFILRAADIYQNNWIKVDDERTNALWDTVYEIASKKYPTLEFKEQNLTKNSLWIRLRPSGIPKNIGIDLKGAQGYADLTFDKIPRDFLFQLINNQLEEHMSIVSVGKSSAIRLSTRKLRIEPISDEVCADIEDVLIKCNSLLSFFRSNETVLRETQRYINGGSDA